VKTKGDKNMPIKITSIQNRNQAEIDKKEQELSAKGFIKVSPLAKKAPYQYSRSKAPADHKSFDGLWNYTIEWCTDE
jgi:hypothetical protein